MMNDDALAMSPKRNAGKNMNQRKVKLDYTLLRKMTAT